MSDIAITIILFAILVFIGSLFYEREMEKNQ